MKRIHGYVNLEELTIKIQFNINNICRLEKMPSFNYSYIERESLGNGWYGSKETKYAREDNAYLVYNNDTIIGFISTTKNGVAHLQGKNSNKYVKKYIKNKILNN